MDIKIKTASIKDLNEVSQVEAKCFPETEAASRRSLEQRIKTYLK